MLGIQTMKALSRIDAMLVEIVQDVSPQIIKVLWHSEKSLLFAISITHASRQTMEGQEA